MNTLLETSMPEGRSYIGGRYVGDGLSGPGFDTINPSTGEKLARLTETTDSEFEQAVSVSKAAQENWAAVPVEERAAVLRRAATLIREKSSEISVVEVADTGRPINEIQSIDIETAAGGLEFFAGVVLAMDGVYKDYPDGMGIFRREPVGVCAGIGAWNYPFQIAAWKAAPALAAGNSMIYKPSEQTPLSALLLAEIFIEAGLPAGVFNVVQGAARIGASLASHSCIDHVSMTGSVSTGRKILASAGTTVKGTTLELGGKSPLLIMEDADIEQAAIIAAMGNFLSCGEICGNTTRVFVHHAIRDAFLEAVRAEVGKIRTGDPMDAATHNGSLISLDHREKVHGFVEDAERNGAQIVCGGGSATVDGLENGAFYAPTVLSNCDDTMRCVRDEIFGPVMSVLSFENENEAVERANASDYGLCAAVVSSDHGRAQKLARRLEAGTIWVNTVLDLPVGFGYGGFKQSGIGYENGLETLREYTRTKGIYTALSRIESPFS